MAGGIRDWLMEKSWVPLEDLEMGMGQGGEKSSRRLVCGGVLRGLVREGMDSRMALGKTVERLMKAGLSCHLGVVPKGLPRLMAEITYSKLSSRRPGSSGTLT